MLRVRNALGVVLLMTSACVGNVLESEYHPDQEGPPGGDPGYDGSWFDGAIVGDAGWGPLPGYADGAAPGWLEGGAPNGDGSVLPGTGMPNGSPDGGVPDGSVGVPDASTQPNDPTAANPCGSGPEPLLADMRIRELALYQTVKVPLYRNNAWVTQRNATVVQGKQSLLRVFVEPLAGYQQRATRAVLTMVSGGVSKAVTADRTITQASSDAAFNSTFDFPLEGATIGGDTQLSVALIETSCPAPRTPAAGARLPESGLRALNASAVGKLRVVVVPVVLSNGLTPDTSPTQLAKLRDALRAYYPVAEVELSARAQPFTWNNTVGPTDNRAWETLLDQIGGLRSRDGVARDVYYYGLITPSSTFRAFCQTSCILGMAPLLRSISSPDQIGLGIGFVDARTYTTLVHEIGHAHGLPHAPCVKGGTIAGPDPNYPYSGALIGSWGWDSRSGQLLEPTGYTDIMAYCDPAWISDYNYEKLATRSRAVNTAALLAGKSAAGSWRRIILSADGSARWGAQLSGEQPGGLSWARALAADGSLLADVQVSVTPLEHADGGAFLYVPELDPSWAALDVGGRIIDLTSIEP